jgi:acyl-CoA synthetase (AMP-forming)/AMP-acid ligase II
VGARIAAEENHHVLDAFDCEVLFFQKQFAPVIAGLRPRLPKIRLWVCIDDELADFPGARSLADWVKDQPATRPDVAVDLDDVVMLSATGGTTGAPKGVMNTHRSAQTFCAHFLIGCSYDPGTTPVNLAAAPMTHTAGLLSVPCTARGGTVVVLSKPDPALLLAAIPKHRITELFLPPTVIYRLLDIPELGKKVDFSSLRYFLYGAAPMSVEKLKLAIEIIGPVMMGGYGQTEAPASISFLPPGEHFVDGRLAPDERLASVGRPNPLIRVEIMNDANEVLPRGQTGEICVRGDLVMKGYYRAPDKTAETMIDGWLHTGDIGYFDADGYLYISDRAKDMIIRGGENVYCVEIENCLAEHPEIIEAAVIGVPDRDLGERVKAVVVHSPGSQLTAADVKAHVAKSLAKFKVPEEIEFTIDPLPRNPAGKILKNILRKTGTVSFPPDSHV